MPCRSCAHGGRVVSGGRYCQLHGFTLCGQNYPHYRPVRPEPLPFDLDLRGDFSLRSPARIRVSAIPEPDMGIAISSEEAREELQGAWESLGNLPQAFEQMGSWHQHPGPNCTDCHHIISGVCIWTDTLPGGWCRHHSSRSDSPHKCETCIHYGTGHAFTLTFPSLNRTKKYVCSKRSFGEGKLVYVHSECTACVLYESIADIAPLTSKKRLIVRITS